MASLEMRPHGVLILEDKASRPPPPRALESGELPNLCRRPRLAPGPAGTDRRLMLLLPSFPDRLEEAEIERPEEQGGSSPHCRGLLCHGAGPQGVTAGRGRPAGRPGVLLGGEAGDTEEKLPSPVPTHAR